MPIPMSRNGRNAWIKVQNMPWTASLKLRRRLAWPLVLGHRGIAVHYDVEAYEQDRQTLKRLGRI